MNKTLKNKLIISAMFLILVFLSTLLYLTVPSIKNNVDGFLIEIGLIKDSNNDKKIDIDSEISVHFIDVGQADSILIITPDGNMLIDSGSGSSVPSLRAYLKNQGIKDFEYVVFTHPHEDHIGGASMIINEFNVKNVILPDCVQTTKVYSNMITAIENSAAKTIRPIAGELHNIGEMKFKILAPINPKYTNINNYSVVLRIDYGANSFIMTGDAEELSEKEILEKFNASELKCDVLKVGHHGSNTSTSEDFLLATSPTYAIISCGINNRYGHPDMLIIDRLTKAGVLYYRTDIERNIIFVCNGKTVVKK